MPLKRSLPQYYARARLLRKDMTPAERRLWTFLRSLRQQGVIFRRQHALGPYIVDFCAPRRKLILEVDGSQHLGRVEQDMLRTKWLEDNGYRVLRFWNGEVMKDLNGVAGVILEELGKGE